MHEAVDDLPHGLETLFAREVFGGAELSGRQRRRLACSRAIYRRPELLILDEPTSQMDARGEHQIDAGRVCGHLELLKRHGFDDMAWCSPEVPCAGLGHLLLRQLAVHQGGTAGDLLKEGLGRDRGQIAEEWVVVVGAFAEPGVKLAAIRRSG